MCTAVVRLDPDGEWPVLVAFVRDEQRDRMTNAPGCWWPERPSAFGGHDQRAGGTWLAVDIASRDLAFVQNQIGPHVTYPDPAHSPSRGGLPVLALGGTMDVAHIERYQPFQLVLVEGDRARWLQWSGSEANLVELQPGLHIIASRGLDLPDERERRATHLERFANATDPRPSLLHDPHEAWGEWLALLDGRDATPGDLTGIVLHSVPERPDFGTVGATLVGIAGDGRIRYDINPTTTLDPAAWSQVMVPSASMSA
jgi:hypothetical protein